MKKTIVFAIAALVAAAACTKIEDNSKVASNAIAFQPANQVDTRVSGSVFPQGETFGTYAWTAGTTGEYFIENERVSFQSGTNVWTTATPYYWPKNQTVDFFSYYPYNVAGTVPTVAKDSIKYSAVDFSATQVDLMYSDKAVGYTDNADQVDDGTQNGFEGVPTIFRHAGAKVRVNIILGENEKHNPGEGIDTKWDVTLKSVVLSGIYIKGDCVLKLSATGNGIIPWTKPSDADGYKVWTPNGELNSSTNTLYTDVQNRDLVKNIGQTVIGNPNNADNPYVYMLPQTLVANQQKITLTCDIKTYRKLSTEENYPTDPTLVQTDVVLKADLLINTGNLATSVLAWEMNQAITYNITLGPAGKQITFDPAIDAWENRNVSSNIELDID